MTKVELDKKAKAILESKVPRNLRSNMVLAGVEDLSRILGISLREVQVIYGRWDSYTLEVVRGAKKSYLLRFPEGQEVRIKWELNPKK